MSEINPDNTTAIAKRSLRWYLEDPTAGYQNRLNQLLGERMPQFCSSLINLANSQKQFEKVRPTSIISAGVVAATLDLPIDKNLGFAWIIPYGELAQFQIGYKGYVQLALRSGRYAGMNAVTVNDEALGGYDSIGDPIINWELLDETKPAVGYAFAWRLTTGFTKVVYWPKAKVEAHALRYSQAYKQKKKDSPWFTDFDKMALKTLITNSLRRWGIMSVEDRFQLALERDQSAAIDVDAVPIYPDKETETFEDPQTEQAPAVEGLADLTEKLNGNGSATAPVATEPGAESAPWTSVGETAAKVVPPSVIDPTPLTTAVKEAELMTLEQIGVRLESAQFVADVRALRNVWLKQDRAEAEKDAILQLCDARIETIKNKA